ncbi:MAG TPA: class I SAM-dependent methyltransferase [Gammaproteobacteria bacterium]|nr:class I SAM-dependent methyltransferase [Gammaproteobacteria bacterium]
MRDEPCRTIGFAGPAQHPAAQALARQLGLTLRVEPAAAELLLWVHAGGLELRRGTAAVRCDFTVPQLAQRLARGRHDLLRALGARGGERLRVTDATAGLGIDAITLAHHGHRVVALERCRITAALLADGLLRARQGPPAIAAAAGRIRLHCREADGYLHSLPTAPDVIYLDPMYGEDRSRAQPRLAMQLLRALTAGEAAPAEAPGRLLAAALARAGRRVVVKRPLRAPALPGPRPHGAIRGRTTRYDIYGIG